MPIALALLIIAVLVAVFNPWMWRKRYGNRDPRKWTGLGLPEESPRIEANGRPLLPPDQQVWLEGPVELIDGKLTLAIPLAQGGAKLQKSASRISYVANDCLNVVIPDWLAAKMGIAKGTTVCVNNRDGRLNITKAQDEQVTGGL